MRGWRDARQAANVSVFLCSIFQSLTGEARRLGGTTLPDSRAKTFVWTAVCSAQPPVIVSRRRAVLVSKWRRWSKNSDFLYDHIRRGIFSVRLVWLNGGMLHPEALRNNISLVQSLTIGRLRHCQSHWEQFRVECLAQGLLKQTVRARV